MAKKEWYRDHATHAFMEYARRGKPTRVEIESQLKNEIYRRFSLSEPNVIAIKAEERLKKSKGLISDIEAVNKVLKKLETEGKNDIIKAIEAVYFANARKGKLDRGEISERVRRFSLDYPCSEKTVYIWLKSARLLFAIERDMYTGYSDVENRCICCGIIIPEGRQVCPICFGKSPNIDT